MKIFLSHHHGHHLIKTMPKNLYSIHCRKNKTKAYRISLRYNKNAKNIQNELKTELKLKFFLLPIRPVDTRKIVTQN